MGILPYADAEEGAPVKMIPVAKLDCVAEIVTCATCFSKSRRVREGIGDHGTIGLGTSALP